MARTEFRLPDVGEGIAEAEIVAWHVAVGDTVREDQPLADMMTDKATVELESPVAGKVIALAGEVGDKVPVGSVLVVLESDADPAPSDKAEPGAGRPAEPALAPAAADRRSEARSKADRRPAAKDADPPSQGEQAAAKRIAASPAVRKRAHDLGIELGDVRSAVGERIRHADLDAHLLQRRGVPATPSVPSEPGDVHVKIVGLRRRIAESVQEAKRRIPHFSYIEEIDMTALEAVRAQMNGDREGQPRLTLLPFLITALCRAVADFPQINATFDDDAGVVTRHAAVHMGVAAQTEAGLLVPVVRDAHDRDVSQLAAEILRLADGARSGSLTREELSGSTVTISSLGALGGIASTPVINRPEVAIVAVNRMTDRPVAIDGKVEIRKMMNLSSSFDHRIIDGWDAARFIRRVKSLLESPSLLLSRGGSATEN